MLRRFLLGIMVVSLASLAWANVPDLNNSSASIGVAEASVFVLPNGAGVGFDAAFAPGGAVVDATVTLTLLDAGFQPIFGFPFEDMWLGTSGGGLVACDGGTTADASTDVNGQTEWQNPLLAGGTTLDEDTLVYIAGTPLPNPLPLTFNSADINGDLTVGLSDAAFFSQDLLNGPYNFRSDFNNDGVINLSDSARMAPAVVNAYTCP